MSTEHCDMVDAAREELRLVRELAEAAKWNGTYDSLQAGTSFTEEVLANER